jgi:alkanesulfonate monooxygenase SsuD/methylene tetrahydromethanopterin reductase-like flavin-dependent oxidoreductase (luciferase family)
VLRLSVLDQSPIRAGGTAADAVAETLELAQACERWGYHRYWLAEHHASRGLAGSTPEVLIAHIAAHTSHLRVGSGGVMLSHYSALKVAENFRMLETLHPGRIDLGIGRLYAGRPGAFPSVEEAESYPYNEQEVAIARHARRRTIAGAPEQVGERLTALAHDYEVEELKVVTIAYDFKARLRSYQLLAEVFELPDRPSGRLLPEAPA